MRMPTVQLRHVQRGLRAVYRRNSNSNTSRGLKRQQGLPP